jgi:pantoate--beta-alanine ligase
MTEVIHEPGELFARCEAERRAGRRVGFVPTMGALHDGHLSLVEGTRTRGARFHVLSIFVNPLQFGPTEDFGRYPRTFDADLQRCRAAGVDVIYAPSPEAMYPKGFQTHVEVGELTKRFEGSFRPAHFRGVTTVVCKLFTAVGPCVALFGRKDYQQWKVLERMARDLDLPVELVGAPIVREPDGLAMSSRNRYLDAPSREKALAIASGLRAAHDAYESGQRDPATLAALVQAPIEKAFDRIDYVEAADPETLEPATTGDRVVLLVAAHLGKTRLIDNLELGHDPRP